MEKRFIIISKVRSNPSGKIGFMDEPRRLNVSATRGKEGVIFIGNAECLAMKNGTWRDLVLFYYSKNLIYQGSLSKLESVPKEEIFIKDIESDKEEEQEKIKMEKHKEVKKEIIKDYFNSLEAAPAPIKEIKNETKEQNEIILSNLEDKSNGDEEEEIEPEEDKKKFKKNKNEEKNKNKKKNSNKNSNKNSEEEEEKEFKEDAKDIKNNKKKDKNKKGKNNSKKNSEEEEEEKEIEEKKKTNNKKNKKEKEQKNKIE